MNFTDAVTRTEKRCWTEHVIQLFHSFVCKDKATHIHSMTSEWANKAENIQFLVVKGYPRDGLDKVYKLKADCVTRLWEQIRDVD